MKRNVKQFKVELGSIGDFYVLSMKRERETKRVPKQEEGGSKFVFNIYYDFYTKVRGETYHSIINIPFYYK